MIILGLDTTGANCSACLVQDDQVLGHMSERIGRGHAERLAPMVAALFTDCDVRPDQVERVAVCTGPGSFTGLRVALSFAKGFALPRKLPVIGINALSVTYLMNPSKDDIGALVFQDVKRNQFMFSHYESQNAALNQVPDVGSLDDLRKAQHISDRCLEVDDVDVIVMALAAVHFDPSAFPADPLYARAPDAKLPGGVSVPS